MSFAKPFVFFLVALATTAGAAPLRSLDDLGDVFMPGPKVAGVDDAWSLYNNPAGIAFVEGAQFVGGYGFRISDVDSGRHQAKSSLALSVIEGLSVAIGLQLSLQQVQSGDDQGVIGGRFAAAYRFGRAFAFGAGFTRQRQYRNSESDPFLFGIGIEAFPTRWLSIGTSVNQVYDDILVKPEVRLGLALRPFGDRFTLSAETLFWPNDSLFNTNFAIYPELGARLDLGGVTLLASARATDVTQGFGAPTIFAGVELNFEHLGFGAVAQGRPSDRLSVGGRFRVSSEVWSTVAPIRERIVSLSIDENGLDANDDLSFSRRLLGPARHSLEVLQHLDVLSQDNTVKSVFLKMPPFAFSYPRAEEIRQAILKLRKADIHVHAHFDSANAPTFLAASAANEISMSAGGEIDLDGFRKSLIYFRKALDGLGINVQATVAGKHKNAPDIFTRSDPSPEELEVRNNILDKNLTLFKSAHPALSQNVIDLGTVGAQEAKQLGLVNSIAYAEDLLSQPSTSRSLKKKHWGNAPQIVVIPISGMIVPGKATPSLLRVPGSTAAAQDIIELLQSAARDNDVSAIVLRIDTPGGDALASNLIHDAVKRARKVKPVVVSMADMAASGGYYIASAANSILAQSSTLTGSIGVFSLHFSAGELANKFGVTQFEIKRGLNPGGTLLRGMTMTEAARKQARVNEDYNLFKQTVASARKMSLQSVELSADGRVFTATEAVTLGLVDRIGGYADAVAEAKRLAHLDDNACELVYVGVGAPPLFALPRLVNAFSEFSDSDLILSGSPMALSNLSYFYPSFLKESL